MTIKEITFLKVAQNKPTQANNGISVVILKSELYHVSPSPSITTAVLTADYGTLFHQIKHQRDVVKATYGPLSEVVSLALHEWPHPGPPETSSTNILRAFALAKQCLIKVVTFNCRLAVVGSTAKTREMRRSGRIRLGGGDQLSILFWEKRWADTFSHFCNSDGY